MLRFRGSCVSRAFLGLCVALASREASARIVSYAPVTSANAVPAVQHRTNRFYLLIERDPRFPLSDPPAGSVVLFDSTGAEAPRTIQPFETGDAIGAAAYREDPDGTQQILLATNHRTSGDQLQSVWRYLYSRDGGRTFVTLDPALASSGLAWTLSSPTRSGYVDEGGPVARGVMSGVRIGTRQVPFVFVAARSGGGREIVAVADAGTTRRLFPAAGGSTGTLGLAGSNADGTSFLVTQSEPQQSRVGLFRVDLDGTSEQLVPFTASVSFGESFLTTTGAAYVSARSSASGGTFPSGTSITYVDRGSITTLTIAPTAWRTFAVPTAAWDGAWIVERGNARPSVLSLHTRARGLVEQWRDVTAPEIEALHVARSGRRLLVQVHRPRVEMTAPLPFYDPALAIWEVGQPAPRGYDELFLVERASRGFVNLDVDALAAGGTFVFDGGEDFQAIPGGGPSGGGAGGGADVSQEFGVVRGALAQRLVIPAVARASGVNGSRWRSDVHVRNPDDRAVSVELRYVPTAAGLPALEKTIALAANEIRVLADVLGGTFGLESGSGALFLTPEAGTSIEATSRTYTETSRGTLGTGVPAFDVFTAAHARYPVYFSAAFPGDGFRTNLVAAGTSGAGGDVLAGLMAPPGDSGGGAVARFGVPAGGHTQVDGLAALLGLRPWETGALKFAPEAGEAVGAVLVIDNGTNDPTMFGPDLGITGTLTRTIPAIVHADGANGARFRSDLYLTNPADTVAVIQLTATSWTPSGTSGSLPITLFPRETRVVRDVLATAFSGSGVASLDLRAATGFTLSSLGVRVASRTYTITPEGTYGLSMPPLSSFQRARSGEALEILGASAGAGFRTNLALLELSGQVTEAEATVEIVGDRGQLLDSFVIRVPGRRGFQIDDVFGSRALVAAGATLIRIRPHGGSIGAYATLIDNGTNDPVYFGANLAARD